MLTAVIIFHVIVCVFLALVVLLQPGAKGGLGGAFGGAGGATFFGGRGANDFLSKLTAGAALCFMLTSTTLVYFSTQRDSVFDQDPSALVSDEGTDKSDGTDENDSAASEDGEKVDSLPATEVDTAETDDKVGENEPVKVDNVAAKDAAAMVEKIEDSAKNVVEKVNE